MTESLDALRGRYFEQLLSLQLLLSGIPCNVSRKQSFR
jgi:hypothetical protein